MVFSSVRFFAFLACLLLVLGPRYSTRRKKQVLAAASCFFYAAWDYRYLGLLLVVSVIDYWCAARIHETTDDRRRKRWLWLSIVSNLGILGYFKYTNFFVATLNGILAGRMQEIPAAHILLPAGISFYTFKSMSYTIDVYRRHISPARSQIDYTTFITFFPELIAGPIVRASVFLPQMERAIGPTTERLVVGANIFVLGLLKKKLIADRMADIADPIFRSPGDYSSASLWCGALAYAIQIYCDFSGYSDMAIGTAKMLGYDLPENFDMPYASASITEFWRRWHMTLSSWLRDYLYIPLGGNRRGPLRTYVNLMTTMLLGGLWHGASWTFVFWGAAHGAALAAHRLVRNIPGAPALPRWLGVPLTFTLVMLLWIPFRASSFGLASTFLLGLFGKSGGAQFYPEFLGWAVLLVLTGHVAGHVFSLTDEPRDRERFGRILSLLDAKVLADQISGRYLVLRGRTVGSTLFATFVLGVLFCFAEATSSPFIYFQF
jgi:alginate O-acetyltransferase complex protein AlgI